MKPDISEQPKETHRTNTAGSRTHSADLDACYQPIADFAVWASGLSVSPDWSARAEQFVEKLQASPPAAVEAVRTRLAREAAAQTGAVEGLYELNPHQTRSIAIDAENWRASITADAPHAVSLIIDQIQAYDFVQESAADGFDATAKTIRELHQIVCQSQDTYTGYLDDGTRVLRTTQVPLIGGAYKTQPNHVVTADGFQVSYAPVDDTPAEMLRLCDQLKLDEFKASPCVVQAAYAHYMFVKIHPFADGNGRVARALASIYTYGQIQIPLVVYADRKALYWQSLRSADRGGVGEFLAYVEDRTLDTMQRATQEIDILSRESLSEKLSSLLQISASNSRLTIQSAAAVGTELFKALVLELEAIGDQVGSEGIEVRGIDGAYLPETSIGEYKNIGSRGVSMRMLRPAQVEVDAAIAVALSKDLSQRAVYRIAMRYGEYNSERPEHPEDLDLRFEDVYPTISTAASARIKLFAEAVGASLVERLTGELRKVLRQAGYD